MTTLPFAGFLFCLVASSAAAQDRTAKVKVLDQATEQNEASAKVTTVPAAEMAADSFRLFHCVRLNNLYFNPNSAKVADPDSLLIELAGIMQEHPDISLRVDGHSDVFERAENDTLLSFQRANAVIQLLQKHGVPANRMEAKAWGGTRPAAPCKLEDGITPTWINIIVHGKPMTQHKVDKDGCARNRRVEFKITGNIDAPPGKRE
jgi:outer membrane protein OmpA-like peptidoglycan-associated protein